MNEIDRRLIHKGRGTVSNTVGRFEPHQRSGFDDGWGSADEPALPLETSLIEDTTRTIIARNQSPDIGFDRSINPYRGCEHGCVYCFARPTHAYLGLSPGLDFESRLFFKPRAAELLRGELSKASYRCQPMALGTNTDPYQPIERKLGITRQIMEVLRDFNHPVTIVTKGALVQRDIDILAPMAERRMARVAVSVTTLDRSLARRMEPRAATPERRLETIRALSQAGIPVSVLAAPMIPGLNDHELEAILEAARDHGALSAGWVLLRLPLEIKDLFTEWLETNAPMRARHVLSLIRDTRHGKHYSSEWGERMRGDGAYADLIAQRFRLAIKRLGLDQRERAALDVSQFRPPPKKGDQLSLF
ncbi:MAG: PA0069 family radical SAM protein [Aliidongia sp.]